jgi:hypothetical protein
VQRCARRDRKLVASHHWTETMSGILSQQFADKAGPGAYLNGSGLSLVVTERGRRYELRDDGDTMTLVHARREERELGNVRLAFAKPLRPADLHRFVNAWVSESIAAAAA